MTLGMERLTATAHTVADAKHVPMPWPNTTPFAESSGEQIRRPGMSRGMAHKVDIQTMAVDVRHAKKLVLRRVSGGVWEI